VKLAEIFPTNCLSTSEEDIMVYSRDASPYEGQCKAVVWPTSTDQIYRLVHYAKRNQLRLTVRGAGTSTYGGCIPSDSIVVDMSKMNKVERVDPDCVVVEAGCVLDDLNFVLKDRKKYFPIVPIEHSVCTIGGMVATNCFGLDRYYGKMEKWVQGLEVVDGTGKKLVLGAVPSTAFLSSEGTLGIICKVKLRIIQRPVYKTYSVFKFNTLTAMQEKVQQLKQNEHVIKISYYDDIISKMIKLGDTMHLVVEYDDEQGIISDFDEINKLEELKESSHHLLVKRKFTQKEDVILDHIQIIKFLNWLRKNGIPTVAYLDEDTIHANFRDYSKLPDEMRDIVKKLGGKLAMEFPIGISRRNIVRKIKREKHLILKNQYDNMNILNRGVIVE
jgi:FAD/FMN-containing dehydrogenase